MQEEEVHNSCKTQFCEEQVAEAALLALGAVLKWYKWETTPERPIDHVRESAQLVVDEDQTNYTVASEPAYLPLVTVHCHSLLTKKRKGICTSTAPDYSEHEETYHYASVAEAKAACEVHAATGQFPPGVEPAVSGPKRREY